MKLTKIQTRAQPTESGYALLLMVFLTAMMVVSTLTIGLWIKTEVKRQKEEEMIWRGKQYVRGIKLYYKKLGRYPTSLEDLTKPQVGNIHFMRQAYKDPMNKEDGAWRLLYVGPSGQLIGSLKPPQSSLLLPQASGFGTPAGAPGGIGGQLPGQQPGSTSQQNATGGQTGTNPTGTSDNQQGANSGTGDAGSSSNPQPITPTETPTIIGGNIIGVGSKVDQKSVKVYEKAKNYKLFEFYWDPSKDAQAAGQAAGLNTGTPQGQNNPFGPQPPANPTNPQGTPPPGAPGAPAPGPSNGPTPP
jgi:hypothetical protein